MAPAARRQPKSLTQYFVDHYLHGRPFWPEQAGEAGYDYVMWKSRVVLQARKTGTCVLPYAMHLIDRDEGCGPCKVLYHYTNEAGFLGITRGGGHEMVMRCSTDANLDAYFGKGLYGTQFEPANERWTSKKDIQFNNYWPRAIVGGRGLSYQGLVLYDQLREESEFPYDHVENFCSLELAHFDDRVDFCIPVLVNEAQEKKLRKADVINAYSEAGPEWRDIWVLDGGQHAHGEYRCSMTQVLKIARLQIMLASGIGGTFHQQLKISGRQMLLQVKRSMTVFDLKDSMVEEAIAAMDEACSLTTPPSAAPCATTIGGEGQEYFKQAYKNYFGAPGMTEPDYPEAHRLAQKAADLGSADGKALLGLGYVCGKGVAKDQLQGASLIQAAAAEGSSFGTACLGECHLWGYGVPEDNAEAVRLYQEAADRDDTYGQRWLGHSYYHGWGVAKSYEEAARWWRLAAELGLAEAQKNIGTLYEYGQGVPMDLAEALRWYERAAKQGHGSAKGYAASLREELNLS